jgi:hypothetical protein
MKKITLLTAVLCIILLPDLAQAQVGLVPTDLCDGPTCSACHIVELINRLIKWLIGIVILLFAVLAVWAGFGLVTSGGNPSALSDAKSRFTNAFIGFLIVLAAWLLVDTLMRGIVSGTDGNIKGYGPWSQVQCFSQSEVDIDPDILDITETSTEPPGAVDATYGYVDPVTGFITTTPAGDPSVAGAGLNDVQVKVLLDGAGIEYKNSVGGDGLKQHVIDELINLNAACDCDITVTSLTDGNHANGQFSHAKGFKADIRSTGGGDPNPKLVSYVQSLPSAGQWRDGTKLHYDADACATYAIETGPQAHIDVEYRTGC